MLCLIAIAGWSGCAEKVSPTGDAGNTESASEIQISLNFNSSPVTVGVAEVEVSVADREGKPLSMGELDLEGNMNHAGMKPVFSTVKESSPGTYTGELEFTMGGDWFVIISGTQSDGTVFEQTVNVPGVQVK